jgi:curli biogenesis system outer membrane secretion channel CsgG
MKHGDKVAKAAAAGLLFLGLFLGLAQASAYAQAAKPRVAVLDFDYGTVRTAAAGIFGTDVDVGKGIADLMVEQFVKNGVYSVIERKAIDKILAEQNLANSDRANSSSAAKIGQILGVDVIIMGSVTQFGRDDKNVNVGGSAISRQLGGFGIGGVGKKDAKAVVGISARMINTSTAEILAAATGKGESKRGGVSLLGAGGGSGTSVGGATNMSSSNFAQTIIGEATMQAVAESAKQLEASASAVPVRKVAVDGLVADVSGSTLILNVGTKGGVKVGDRLDIRRKDREIRDPATGKVIRTMESQVGEIVITEADEGSSVGKFSGSGTPKTGDAVKSKP